MQITQQAFTLAFLTPFEISKLKRSSQDVLRVRIEKDGYIGYGETPAISYYGKKIVQFAEDLNAVIPDLEKCSWDHPSQWYVHLLNILPEDSFLRAALDAAAWDIYGQQQGKMVWEVLDLPNPAHAHSSNFTIGIGSPEYVVDQIKQYPWPSYKLKLGSAQDRKVLETVARSTTNPIRIDANGAWTAAETLDFLNFCIAKLPVGFLELIEEPYSDLSDPLLMDIKNNSPIPFYADESFQSLKDLERIPKYFHGINVKLDKCGGITPALEIIRRAKEQGLKIQLGCMSASGVALAPAIQLSGLADVIDLDAALMIEQADFGVKYLEGVAVMEGKIGMGTIDVRM